MLLSPWKPDLILREPLGRTVYLEAVGGGVGSEECGVRGDKRCAGSEECGVRGDKRCGK